MKSKKQFLSLQIQKNLRSFNYLWSCLSQHSNSRWWRRHCHSHLWVFLFLRFWDIHCRVFTVICSLQFTVRCSITVYNLLSFTLNFLSFSFSFLSLVRNFSWIYYLQFHDEWINFSTIWSVWSAFIHSCLQIYDVYSIWSSFNRFYSLTLFFIWYTKLSEN